MVEQVQLVAGATLSFMVRHHGGYSLSKSWSTWRNELFCWCPDLLVSVNMSDNIHDISNSAHLPTMSDETLIPLWTNEKRKAPTRKCKVTFVGICSYTKREWELLGGCWSISWTHRIKYKTQFETYTEKSVYELCPMPSSSVYQPTPSNGVTYTSALADLE